MQMIKSFLVSMFAVLLFALGAVGSWFYLQMESKDSAEEETQPIYIVGRGTRRGPCTQARDQCVACDRSRPRVGCRRNVSADNGDAGEARAAASIRRATTRAQASGSRLQTPIRGPHIAKSRGCWGKFATSCPAPRDSSKRSRSRLTT